MSVVVRMEMPKDGVCDGCGAKFVDSLAGSVCAISKKFLGSSRPSWCPIICQLPEGHGDLIDRDSMVEEWVDEKIGNPHADYEADDVIYDLKKTDRNCSEG